MCDKPSPVGEEKQSTRTSNRIKKRKHMESTSHLNIEPSRKFRKKTKKRKVLSRKLELTKNKKKGADTRPFKEKKRVETVGGEKDEEHYDTVAAAYLFNTSSAVLLECDGGRNLSPYDHGSSSSPLHRTAMKKGASEEERWVSYSEVMSRSGDGNDGRVSLALKLDYEQVMEAWTDKGTLYVDGEPPQTVPDLHASVDVFTGGGELGSLWTVPEMKTTERLWRGHREASLLRYKEKRQNRLFSKRIRYQVRQVNAEKRPRIKGRFVKRDDL